MRIGIDGITSIASDVAVLTVNYVASRMGLISNPDEYSEITTNKYLMRECFTMNNIPSPRYTIASKDDTYNIKGFNFPSYCERLPIVQGVVVSRKYLILYSLERLFLVHRKILSMVLRL